MSAVFGSTRVNLVQGDITLQEVDAVVNAANSTLMGGGGVDGAIHRAGGPEIKAACREIVAARGPLPPGQAVATPGGRLPARLVIHTVGPVWHGGTSGEVQTLSDAYRSSLAVARGEKARTVAFPSISTGAYGYPVDRAAAVALAIVWAELEAHPQSMDEVRFVLFDRRTLAVYDAALTALVEEPDSRGAVEARAFLDLVLVAGGVGPWHLSLSELAAAHAAGSTVTVGTVATGLGLESARVGMVMINGCKATLDSPVAAGDRVAMFPIYVPYHRAYGMCIL